MTNPSRPKVLIVDDEMDLTFVISAILNLLGYDCKAANSAAEAVQELQSEEYQAVICDVSMPDIDGLSLFQVAREIIPNCPGFIFCSGHAEFPVHPPYPEGIVGFAQKPVSMTRFGELLKQAVSRGNHQPVTARTGSEASDPVAADLKSLS